MIYKLILSLMLFSLTILGGWSWIEYQNAWKKPVVPGTQISIEIEKGDSFEQITAKLLEKNVNIKPFWFKMIAIQQKAAKKLKIGEYELKGGLTIPEILAVFVEGKPKQYAITFPEGWTFKDVLQEIAKNPNVQHTLTDLDSAAVIAQLGLSVNHPEGVFFPDTYFFEKHTSDVALLKRAYERMQQVLEEEWHNKTADLPIKSPYEALILASIIEKETGAKAERPMIAGVFTRRLQTGMLLQTDPTVIYGMGEHYQGNITAKDLTAATPYNTYTIKGLPPTPIALPGREAIAAALHPEPGNSLYFVARGDGTHVFSATLAEHNAAVDVYQRKKVKSIQ